jgi:hypothetical protein
MDSNLWNFSGEIGRFSLDSNRFLGRRASRFDFLEIPPRMPPRPFNRISATVQAEPSLVVLHPDLVLPVQRSGPNVGLAALRMSARLAGFRRQSTFETGFRAALRQA